MPTPKTHRPSVSDIALAMATRRSDPVSKVSLSLNAKGDVQIEVDVNDADPRVAMDTARVIFAALRKEYPRENGAKP